MRPRLAVTLGDPRGIGPELVARAVADAALVDLAELVLVGPSGAGVDVHVDVGAWHVRRWRGRRGRLAGRAIEAAVSLAARGEVQGIVTAPLDKAALHAGGYDFPGHTEMLGALTGTVPAMMLAATRPSVPVERRCGSSSPRRTSRCATCPMR